jgi:hypothetical protein
MEDITKDVNFFLNTIPPRLEESKSLRASVDSLLLQSVPPKGIYVCIPKFYKRFNQTINDEDIPRWLLDYSNSEATPVKILTGEDYGPASRYVYAKRIGGMMCAADDDVAYKRYALEKLLDYKTVFNLDAASNWSYLWWNNVDDPSDIDFEIRYLQGVDMILMHTSNLEGLEDYLERIHKNIPFSFLCDDIAISFFLRFKNKKSGSINTGEEGEPIYVEQPSSSESSMHQTVFDGLGRGIRFNKTTEIISYLKENYPIKKLNRQQ